MSWSHFRRKDIPDFHSTASFDSWIVLLLWWTLWCCFGPVSWRRNLVPKVTNDLQGIHGWFYNHTLVLPMFASFESTRIMCHPSFDFACCLISQEMHFTWLIYVGIQDDEKNQIKYELALTWLSFEHSLFPFQDNNLPWLHSHLMHNLCASITEKHASLLILNYKNTIEEKGRIGLRHFKELDGQSGRHWDQRK